MTIAIRGTDLLAMAQLGGYMRLDTTVVNNSATTVVIVGDSGFVETGSANDDVIPAAEAPAGKFGELQAINMSAAGGVATGANEAACDIV